MDPQKVVKEIENRIEFAILTDNFEVVDAFEKLLDWVKENS